LLVARNPDAAADLISSRENLMREARHFDQGRATVAEIFDFDDELGHG
jgi:hypothetical protein